VSAVQYRLLRLLAGRTARVVAVGDPDQSVYGWRGADAQVCARFVADFGTRAGNVRALGTNFRCAAPVAAAAHALIAAGDDGGAGDDARAAGDASGAAARAARRCGVSEVRTPPGAGAERVRVFRAYDDREEAAFVAAEIRRLLAGGVLRSLDEVKPRPAACGFLGLSLRLSPCSKPPWLRSTAARRFPLPTLPATILRTNARPSAAVTCLCPASKVFITRQVAVLFRTNAQSRPLEEALARARLPFRMVGAQRFFARKEVQVADDSPLPPPSY
jgi:superfamily I DNA/RNA helicase